MDSKIIIRILKVVAWIGGLYASAYYSFHTIYFILSGFYLMFTNLGKRQKGSLSAYSVFNDNFERLHGTMDGTELFKGGLRDQRPLLVVDQGKGNRKESIEEDCTASEEQYFKNQSRYSNKPCFCGSSHKFKKCCLVTSRKRALEERMSRIKSS